ncbi:MAG: enoyl-CoA hydratase, partial [Rhizorhabdus sp.]|nr:enoyl-CoA hydratase [Rhizorhabdus sp.]
RGRALNYGSDKVRFVVPVRPGDALRLTMTLAKLTPMKGGRMLQSDYVMEVQGGERPAMVAEILTLMYD